jgi:hypothetical protein
LGLGLLDDPLAVAYPDAYDQSGYEQQEERQGAAT